MKRLTTRKIVEVRDETPVREAIRHVVVANIELRVVEALLARRRAAKAITAGYLADKAPRVPGWTQVSRLGLDGWTADLLVAE